MARATVTKGGWYWDGKKQRVGDVVDASRAQIRDWQVDGYVAPIGPVGIDPTPAPVPPATSPTAPAAGRAEPDNAPDWPHKITPEQYVHRFPDGPDADLARSILGEKTD